MNKKFSGKMVEALKGKRFYFRNPHLCDKITAKDLDKLGLYR